MKVNLKRINKAFHYEASTEEKVTVNIDANSTIGGEGKGTRPMELLLMGVAGCASIDLGLILKKQKQELTDYNVEVTAERNDNVAKNFKSINLHFILYGNLDDSKVERAIELTLTKYCSVALSLDKEIEITSTYEIK
ncbi:MAG: OsmC family protein [Flavobacteriales bacterium]|nr:OsmC family protein [Flavobacteriales bacterium]